MKRHFIVLNATVCFAAMIQLASAVPTFADSYHFVTLNFPGSTSGTAAVGINSLGQVVGIHTDTHGATHGFLYKSGKYYKLDAPQASFTSGSGSYPTGINDKGEVVGWYEDANDAVHGFLYSGTAYTTLDDPLATNPPQTATYLNGISDRDQIIGTYRDNGGRSHAFIDDGGNFTEIVYASDAIHNDDLSPSGINDDGTIVGSGSGYTGNGYGFLDMGGQFTTFNYPGASHTEVCGINQIGLVVGWYYVGSYLGGSNVSHGFLYNRGVCTKINVPGATGGAFVSGISALGQIVGQYTDASGKMHGFLATPA